MTATDAKPEKTLEEKPADRALSPKAEENERGQWSSQWDFFLSIVGYAVGIGNVWRFPYLCYKNGGGAFLVPYVIMLLTTGLPLLCLELVVGQYASLGPNLVFRHLSPIFSGIGYGMIVITFFVSCYYNMVISWTIFYTAASFRSVLGWSNCANDYNTANCYTLAEEQACQNSSDVSTMFWNKTCYPVSAYCSLHNFTTFNATHCASNADPNLLKPYGEIGHRISASEDFFTNYVLGLFDHDWSNYGSLKWDLSLCTLAAWIIVGLCLIKGVKSSGKVVYVTAVFPYFVLIGLFFRGITLDGASEGIAYYITPNISSLADSRVWSDAATQIFFSFGVSFGGIITLASYNRFEHNCMKDALVLGVINCSTSVFAGFVVFSVLGFMAKRLGKEVREVVASGAGLTFIAYPEAVVHLPISPLWAVLFFTMVITLGLDSQFAMVETLLTAIYDQWPHVRKRKALVVTTASVMGFFLSLSMCTGGGIHLFTLLDWYASSWSILVLTVLELIVVGWVYGADRLLKNMQGEMGIHIPRPLWYYWYYSWKLVTPVIICGILVFSAIQYAPAYYGSGVHKVVYSSSVNAVGWAVSLLPMAMVPIMAAAVYRSLSKHMSVGEMLRSTPLWCPASQRDGAEGGAVPVTGDTAPEGGVRCTRLTPLPQTGVDNAGFTVE